MANRNRKKPPAVIYDPASREYKIPLTRGAYAIVDLEDVEFLSQWCWGLRITRWGGRYAVGHDQMHTVIVKRAGLNLAKGLCVDHKDGNGLNNRRSNLRIATFDQNMQNAKRRHDNTSGFKGVSWDKQAKKWRARIQAGGKGRFLGHFDTKEEAAAAYARAAGELHGEFARLN